MQGRQKEGGQKRKERMAQLEIKRTQDIRNMRLSDFTPRELMVELKRRGYKFTAEITVTNVIDSDNL
jgi:DNA polymerase III alpha subunit (gram-positive type)